MIMVVVSVLIVFVIIKVIAPYAFMILLGKDHTMPTPSTLMLWYMILAILACLVYVSTSDLKWANFLSFILPAGDDKFKAFNVCRLGPKIFGSNVERFDAF